MGLDSDLSKLSFGIAVAFVLPMLAYAIGAVWNTVVGGARNPKIRNGWKAACLLMPVAFLAMIVQLDGEGFRNLWSNSPAVLVAIVAVFFVLAPIWLICRAVRFWRTEAQS